ncbi:MAG: DUF790 family protein [Kofleriaceae bacterium]
MIARDLVDHDGDLVGSVEATDIRLYDASDRPWITIVIDHVMSCLGQPYRVLRERLEHAPIRGDRVAAILGAMRRLMDGRAQRTKVARKVRASVLGPPALDDDARAARIAKASDELGIDPAEIESLLWIDLADERPVVLPDGRPDEQRLAAFANVDRIQRALRRARHVRIHVWGDAHPLIRTAARYGLLVRVSSPDEHTILDIVGPLTLFHQTQVYGRSLGGIVPHLAGLARFVVEIDAELGFGSAALRVTSPALLPPVPNTERKKPSIATKIASALDRTRGVLVERDPPPIAHGTDRLFPDLLTDVTDALLLERQRDLVAQGRDAHDDRDERDRHAGHRDTRDHNKRDRDHEPEGRDVEDECDLVPDLAALLAASMSDEADRIESGADARSKREREIRAELPAAKGVDRSRGWFVEVVGFATSEYLNAKLARYEAAGIERVVLVVDDTRDAALATVRRVVGYKARTIVADLLAVMGVPDV